MKWGIVLKEKEACTGRELGLVVKESPGLLKGSWVLDQRHLEDGPDEGKARFGEGPRCSRDSGLFSLLSEDQTHLDGLKGRSFKVMKVVGGDGSKEVLRRTFVRRDPTTVQP